MLQLVVLVRRMFFSLWLCMYGWVCVCLSVRLELHVCCLWCLHRTHVKSVVKNQKAYINHPFLSLCVSGPAPNSCCRTSCWWTSSAGPVQCGASLNTLMLQHCSGHSYMLPFLHVFTRRPFTLSFASSQRWRKAIQGWCPTMMRIVTMLRENKNIEVFCCSCYLGYILPTRTHLCKCA